MYKAARELEEQVGGENKMRCEEYKSVRHTLPPRFIPRTAKLRAGGGLGPPNPEKLPPPWPPSSFLAFLSFTGRPTMNSNGCAHRSVNTYCSAPVILFSKSNETVYGYFDPSKIFFVDNYVGINPRLRRAANFEKSVG